jgi:hypothetical protein
MDPRHSGISASRGFVFETGLLAADHCGIKPAVVLLTPPTLFS